MIQAIQAQTGIRSRCGAWRRSRSADEGPQGRGGCRKCGGGRSQPRTRLSNSNIPEMLFSGFDSFAALADLPDPSFGRVGPDWLAPADAEQLVMPQYVTQWTTCDSFRYLPAGRPKSARCRVGGGRLAGDDVPLLGRDPREEA